MRRLRVSSRLWFRRRAVPVAVFDGAANRWTDVDAAGAVERNELTVATFNVWFSSHFAGQRYHSISDVLARDMPDVMVFQEVTPTALKVFLAQPWIRDHYLRAAVTDDDLDYGMLMLSRIPINRVTYTRLPTRLSRGYLMADFTINGAAMAIASVHLDSGKSSSRLRARQLRRIFHALRTAENAVVLGDFNMRDAENGEIDSAYCDLWPALRPHDDGFTEDTSINLMRYDMKNKHRHVRFDRVLLKSAGWAGVGIELLGTAPISSELPRVFPSDHFGVLSRLAPNRPDPADVNCRWSGS